MIVGVLGAGQLGRMLALAGYPLGLGFRFLDPAPGSPAAQVGEQVVAAFDNHQALEHFARGVDVVTYEFENVPVATARLLARHAPVFPPPAALETAQDRLVEKSFFGELLIPTPPFAAVETKAELMAGLRQVGLPAVVKTRRFGYDGKGQQVIRDPAQADAALAELGGQPLIVERLVDFERELSIIAVRSQTGEMAYYPLVENQHRHGILRLSRAPAPNVSERLQAQAEGYAARVMERLEYVGVLAIEFFEVGGELLANELAPRVHNSGHWTIEGADTSQFENHLRAVAGLPLGSTGVIGHSAMLNLIGALPDPAAVLAVPGAHLHLYGKAPRPARKLGHITVRVDDAAALGGRIVQIEALPG